MKENILNIEKLFVEFSSSKTLNELNIIISKYINNLFNTYESSLFLLNEKNIIIDFEKLQISEVFKEKVEYFEEQGIIKWVILSKEFKVIPELDFDSNKENLNYYLLPIYVNNNPFSILIFSSNDRIEKIKQFQSEMLEIGLLSSIVWNQLNCRETLIKLEKKFQIIENQIFKHSFIESLTDVITTIADEITSSIKLIETNFHLILSGIGDSRKRIDLVNSNIDYIKKINDKLQILLSKNELKEFDKINLKLIIDDILEFTGFKLRKENIKILFKFDENISKPIIYASYSQLEKALFNIIIFCSEMFDESGKIELYLYETEDRIHLTISDNSNGISEEHIPTIFEPLSDEDFNWKVNLYFARKAIIKNNGIISFHSVVGQGNTFKISFPKIKNDNL